MKIAITAGTGFVVRNIACMLAAECLAEPAPACDVMPSELAPRIRLRAKQTLNGLPRPGPFTWRDSRCCTRQFAGLRHKHSKRVLFEMP